MSRRGCIQRPGNPASHVRLHVRERGNDLWHDFDSIEEAARFALDLDGEMPERLAFPLAIWDGDAIVWGSMTATPATGQHHGTLRELAGR